MNTKQLNDYTEIAHRAVQLITKASKSWMVAKDDDSHTNSEWDVDFSSFKSHVFQNGLQVEFSLVPFQINILKDGKSLASISIEGKKHSDIESEMLDALSKLGFDKSKWNSKLHFDLPYDALENFVYPKADETSAQLFIQLRSFAQSVFENYGKEYNVDLGLRTWPHHFDLGGLTNIKFDDNNEVTASIGMGLAMADSATNEYYLYVNHWKEGGIEDYPNPTPLPHQGYWLGNPPMAVFKVSDLAENGNYSITNAVDFIDQAVKESARFVVLS